MPTPDSRAQDLIREGETDRKRPRTDEERADPGDESPSKRARFEHLGAPQHEQIVALGSNVTELHLMEAGKGCPSGADASTSVSNDTFRKSY